MLVQNVCACNANMQQYTLYTCTYNVSVMIEIHRILKLSHYR